MNNIDLTLKSYYVPMRDDVRLAVSVWLPRDEKTRGTHPVVLMTTRYWRAMAFKAERNDLQGSYEVAKYFWQHGYCLVISDARGSGASFGTRRMELSPDEIADIGEIIEWTAVQPWCDNRVATAGVSYEADTTFLSFVANPPQLKLGVSWAVDFDTYRHVMTPGGILNTWMYDTWGGMTGAQDRNDVKALFADAPAEYHEIKKMALGVLPVDEDIDGSMLAKAVAGHEYNFNFSNARLLFEFIDNTVPGSPDISIESCSTYYHRKKIEASGLPFIYQAGWYDSGTPLGAINLFTTFSNPKRIIIGPWDHGGEHRADPFQKGDGTTPEAIPGEQVLKLNVASLDAFFKKDAEPLEMDVLEYYTLGENKWKSTKVWPLPETKRKTLYLSENNTLDKAAPTNADTSDFYKVDSTASTGEGNRWQAQMGRPVFHPDRQAEDKKLLVYDSPPTEADMEITGHPIIRLFVRSTTTDGHFFAYLEVVEPDGRVRLITDGQLRAIHRKISDETPPYTMFGPYHTFKKQDAMPLVPGEVAEIAFDLLPISVLFKKGQRIRLAIAGADQGMFEPVPGCESPEITVERNTKYKSCLDLPIIPR